MTFPGRRGRAGGSRDTQGIAEHLVDRHNDSRFDVIVRGELYARTTHTQMGLAAHTASAGRDPDLSCGKQPASAAECR